MKYLLGITVILAMSISSLVLAQDTAVASDTAEMHTQHAEEELSDERITELITTLESETARTELLENLKTLNAAVGGEQESTFSLSEILMIDATSNSLMSGFLRTIEELGFSDSAIGKLLVLFVVLIVLLVLLLLNRRLARYLNLKADALRERFHLSRQRFQMFFTIELWFGYLLAFAILIYSVTEIFTVSTYLPIPDDLGLMLARTVLLFLILGMMTVAIWELVNSLMEYGINENSSLNSARVRTLMPVIRNLVFIIFLIIAVLVVLSELGVDIVPLMASAGILGIAVGFGAQTMVKDFLNGFIIILEDLLQVGDVIEVGGRRGLVEVITLRKVQLRNLDGTVHTVPYSEIAIVDNLTKDYSYYLMDVGVAYKENVDDVMDKLREIDKQLSDSEEFSRHILAPLEILGVDEFADSAVMIKARIKTVAHEKWLVGREFNRRLKHAFDEAGIEIPFPHQTLYFGDGQNVFTNTATQPPAEKLTDTGNTADQQKAGTSKAARERTEYSGQHEEAVHSDVADD